MVFIVLDYRQRLLRDRYWVYTIKHKSISFQGGMIIHLLTDDALAADQKTVDQYPEKKNTWAYSECILIERMYLPDSSAEVRAVF